MSTTTTTDSSPPVEPSTNQLIHQPNQPLLLLPDPEPWPKPVDGGALLDELVALFRRHVILPPFAEETLALWTLHTYAFELRDITAYLGLESPEKRCGKTTLLGVLSRLVYRPVVAANISPPAFFRVIQDLHPTLLIDEADTFVRGNDKLRGILNAGYSRATAYVVRVGQQRASDEKAPLRTFSCWCPKVMAAIGRLPETLADRCIVLPMQRKELAAKCQPLRSLDTRDMRSQAARFVLDHRQQIADGHPEIPDAINDRAGDIWGPLLVLADIAGGDWPQQARQAAVQLTDLAQETSPVAGLFLGITGVFALQKTQQLFSHALVEGLNRLPFRLWRHLTKGKDLSERWLAQLLRPYGIAPIVLCIDNRRARGYIEQDFHEPFRRYVTRAQADALLAEISEHPKQQSQPGQEPGQPPQPSDQVAEEPGQPSGKSPEYLRLERQLERLEKWGQRLARNKPVV